MQFTIFTMIALAATAIAAPVVEVAVAKRHAIPAGAVSAFQQACQVTGGNFNCCSSSATQVPAGNLLGVPVDLALQCNPIVSVVNVQCILNNNAASCCNLKGDGQDNQITQTNAFLNANVPISALNGCNFIGL